MRLCSHCNAQFSDEFASCIHCDRKLKSPGESDRAELPDLSTLYHLTDDHPAKIASLLNRLTDAGIAFTLITDSGIREVNWHRGSSGSKATASVYVDSSAQDQAIQLHRDFLEELIPHLKFMPDSGAAPEGSCPACHDPVSPSDPALQLTRLRSVQSSHGSVWH